MSAKQPDGFSPGAGDLIDGPSPFAPLETWIAFREELRGLPLSLERDVMLDEANSLIRKKRAAEKSCARKAKGRELPPGP
jgi:hypothetical protein